MLGHQVSKIGRETFSQLLLAFSQRQSFCVDLFLPYPLYEAGTRNVSTSLEVGVVHPFEEYPQHNGKGHIRQVSLKVIVRIVVHHSEQYHAHRHGYPRVAKVLHVLLYKVRTEP